MLNLVALLLLLGASTASSAVTGTSAYDYRNNPSVGPLLDREMVVLSARGMFAPGRVDSLLGSGVKPWMLVQPNQSFVNGLAIGSRPGDDRTFPWDTATYQLAMKHGAIMRDSTGAYLDMFGGTQWQSMVLDFRNRAFGADYAALLVSMFPRLSGLVLDYGCGDLAWMGLKVPLSVWPDWRAGWIAYLAELRRLRPDLVVVSQCDKWQRDLPVDGVLLEQAGYSLQTPAKAFSTTRDLVGAGKRAHYWQEWSDKRTRRFFAAIALMFDGTYRQTGTPNIVPPVNYRHPEHFDLSVGVPGSAAWERAPGVWQRMYTRGLVILNVTGATMTYQYNQTTAFTIPPGDALVLQNRDTRGRFIVAKTNAGR